MSILVIYKLLDRISEFFHCPSCVTSPPEEDLPSENSEDHDPYSAKNLEAMANQADKRIAETRAKQAQSWAKPKDHCFQKQASTSHSTQNFNLKKYLQDRENYMTVIDLP